MVPPEPWAAGAAGATGAAASTGRGEKKEQVSRETLKSLNNSHKQLNNSNDSQKTRFVYFTVDIQQQHNSLQARSTASSTTDFSRETSSCLLPFSAALTWMNLRCAT